MSNSQPKLRLRSNTGRAGVPVPHPVRRASMPLALLAMIGVGTLLPTPRLSAGQIKDAESATHGFEAASYQVIATYPFPGFKVIQFELGVLSHYSYLLVSGKEALGGRSGPRRDTRTWKRPQKEGVAIAGV